MKGLPCQLASRMQVSTRQEVSKFAADADQAGLAPYWPYCNAAKRLTSVIMSASGTSKWDALQWRRRLERFGEDDGPIMARGPNGEVDGVWQVTLDDRCIEYI